MTDDGNPQSTPPASPDPTDPTAGATAPTSATPTSTSTTDASPEPGTEKKPAGVSAAMLVWVGVGVVLLSFVAAFLGSWLAQSADSTEAAATPAPTPTYAYDEAAYEDALEEILPAGSAVRAGTGVPEEGKGYEGDVFIDISSSDVYLFQDGEWTLVGNIRESAAENLTGAPGEQGATGETGAQGETGATGETGAQGEAGAPGAPGTQVLLGVGEPDPKTCTADGDIFIDTATVSFYECSAGSWTLFGPPSDPAPPTEAAPAPEPTDEPVE